MRLRARASRTTGSLLRRSLTDPDAFAEFYDCYSRRVLLFFSWRLNNVDVAFDLMSETFAMALERRSQFRGNSAEEEQGWLFAIARSELSHYWRRGGVERASLARLGLDPPGLTDAEIERIEDLAGSASVREELASALKQLPEDQRRAVELRVVAEKEYGDIASELAVSEDVVRARVSRGLRTLRELLPDAGLILEEAA